MKSAVSSGTPAPIDLQKEEINLLLFGCDFFPIRKTSEINFWNDLVDIFACRFKSVVILSVNNRRIPVEKLAPNVFLYNVRPYYPGNTTQWKDPEYTGQRFHKLPLSIIYKTYTLLYYLPAFERLIKLHNINVVHYMRIFGLMNSQLTRRFPEVLFSITVPTHIDRGFPLHRLYHTIKNQGLQAMDKIIPTSSATLERLLDLGIDEAKLAAIPWSLAVEDSLVSSTVKSPWINQLYTHSQVSTIALWSGPLQHTDSREFYYALEVARQVTSQREDFLFVFAFKPDKLKADYQEAVIDLPNAKILETDRHQFSELRTSADVFLSPICNPNRTVAPPLTWIEMMRCGIPVLTTNVPGVDEIIKHSETGFVANGLEETVDLLLTVDKSELKVAGAKSAAYVNKHYNLVDIADQYTALWQTALRQKQHFLD